MFLLTTKIKYCIVYFRMSTDCGISRKRRIARTMTIIYVSCYYYYLLIMLYATVHMVFILQCLPVIVLT